MDNTSVQICRRVCLMLCIVALSTLTGSSQSKAQNQDVSRIGYVVETHAGKIAALEGRLATVETLLRDVPPRGEARLSVIENDMIEIKWLTRTVAAALVAQMVSGLYVLRRKNGGAA